MDVDAFIRRPPAERRSFFQALAHDVETTLPEGISHRFTDGCTRNATVGPMKLTDFLALYTIAATQTSDQSEVDDEIWADAALSKEWDQKEAGYYGTVPPTFTIADRALCEKYRRYDSSMPGAKAPDIQGTDMALYEPQPIRGWASFRAKRAFLCFRRWPYPGRHSELFPKPRGLAGEHLDRFLQRLVASAGVEMMLAMKRRGWNGTARTFAGTYLAPRTSATRPLEPRFDVAEYSQAIRTWLTSADLRSKPCAERRAVQNLLGEIPPLPPPPTPAMTSENCQRRSDTKETERWRRVSDPNATRAHGMPPHANAGRLERERERF